MKTTGQNSILLSPFNYAGRKTLTVVNSLGASMIFFWKSFILIFRPKQVSEIIRQIYHIGAKSANIVMLVGLFTGMVLGLQLYYAMVKLGSEGVLGSVLSLSLFREMGPVLTAIMVTARAGSSMTAEIGIQRITEQIDALETMRINPIRYLVSPRIAASIISFPLLTAFFNLVGILGGYATGVLLLGVNSGSYFYRVQTSLEMSDITGGIVKSLIFGAIVSTICCYQGFFTHMREESSGARSVSISTTTAVVLSCVLILVSDYVVTSFYI
jgi:phospholipid/cholesterol/gamma-HCH transport system permease protein